MNKLRVLILLTLIGGLLVLGLSLLEYLALTDIQSDYVSRSVLEQINIPAANLPAWSATPGEWQMVTAARLASLGFLLFNTLILGLCWRALRHSNASS
ncbi:MAG: hypothetical protein AB1453_00535 [Chloroflexota bacterium]|jgi:hypothetical protein